MNTTATTYRKRSSANGAIQGQWYEIKLIMLIVIQAIIAGFKFNLANNMELAGDFDDVVVDFQYVQFGVCVRRSVFLQAKHVVDPLKNKITLKHLQDTKGKFSLCKYFASYEKIMSNHGDFTRHGFEVNSGYLVIYTNTNFDLTAAELFEPCATPNRIINVLKSSNSNLYKLKQNKYDLCVSLVSRDPSKILEVKMFFDKLLFMVAQGNEADVETKIKECISERFDEHNKADIHINYKKSYDGYQSWWLQQDLVPFLTHNYDLFLLNSASFVKHSVDFVRQNIETDLQGKHIKLSLFGKEHEEILIQMFRESKCVELKTIQRITLLGVATVLQIFRFSSRSELKFVDSQLLDKNGHKILCNFKNSHRQQTIAFYLKHKLVNMETLIKFLNISQGNTKKSVIIIHDNEEWLTKGFSFVNKIPHKIEFSLLSEEYKQFILNSDIKFQNENIKISHLFIGNAIDCLNETLLADILLHNEVSLNAIYKDDLQGVCNYVPRSFTKYYVTDSIVSKCKLDVLVIAVRENDFKKFAMFGYIQEAVSPTLNRLSSKNVFLTLNNTRNESSKIFQDLCSKSGNKNVHFLKLKGEYLEWITSKGSVKSLTQDLKHKNISEEELVQCCNDEKMVIVSDIAGMGKTTVLNSLANIVQKTFPQLWIVKLNLSNNTHLLFKLQKSKNENRVMNFFRNSLKLSTELDKIIFQSMFTHGQVALFLDGFDEISPMYESTVVQLLKDLKSRNIKQIYLTSRPHLREFLEENLHVLTYKLNELNKEEQVKFICKAWLQRRSCISTREHQIQNVATQVVEQMSTLTSKQDIEICGIPLQLKMLVETYPRCNLEVQALLERNKFVANLASLYQSFIENKIKLCCFERYNIDPISANSSDQLNTHMSKAIETHQLLAMALVFNEKDRQDLLSAEELQKISNIYKSCPHEIARFGIVTSITAQESCQFIHRTFAEYLAATFLCGEKLQNQTNIIFIKNFAINVLIQKEFQVLRTFLNSLVHNITRSTKILTLSVLCRDRFWVNIGLENIGKTALHVAAREHNHHLLKYLASNLIPECHETRLILNSYYNNYTVLHILAEESKDSVTDEHKQIIEILVSRGASYSKLTKNSDHSLLDLSLENKHVFDYVLQLPKLKSRKSLTLALRNAQMWKKVDSVRVLIDLVNVKKLDFAGSLLHWAFYERHFDVMMRMIEKGVDISILDGKGQSLLHKAANDGNIDIVKFLLQHEADVNLVDSVIGNSVLHDAVARNDSAIVKCCLDYGAVDIKLTNNRGQSMLQIAVQTGSVEALKYILEHAGVDIIQNEGDIMLHSAANDGYVDIVKCLLTHGADVNAKDESGMTVLHRVAYKGHLNVIQCLLDHGAHS